MAAAHRDRRDSGFAVHDTESSDIVTGVEPDMIAEGDEDEIPDEEMPTPDCHGIGAGPTLKFDGYASHSY